MKGWKTLARAQMNLGEVELALKSYQKSLLLNPSDDEIQSVELPFVISMAPKVRGHRLKVWYFI